jgi:hypothetical protein
MSIPSPVLLLVEWQKSSSVKKMENNMSNMLITHTKHDGSVETITLGEPFFASDGDKLEIDNPLFPVALPDPGIATEDLDSTADTVKMHLKQDSQYTVQQDLSSMSRPLHRSKHRRRYGPDGNGPVAGTNTVIVVTSGGM